MTDNFAISDKALERALMLVRLPISVAGFGVRKSGIYPIPTSVMINENPDCFGLTEEALIEAIDLAKKGKRIKGFEREDGKVVVLLREELTPLEEEIINSAARIIAGISAIRESLRASHVANNLLFLRLEEDNLPKYLVVEGPRISYTDLQSAIYIEWGYWEELLTGALPELKRILADLATT